MRIPFVLAAALCASACATVPAGYEDARGDSLEGVSRGIYSFNTAIDSAVLKPTAKGYRDVVPAPARSGVTNAFQNIGEPLSFVNALLQGKIKRAFRAVDRFAVNTTYGFLGTTDRAAELGLARQQEDFGQTLAVWGVGSGPFVMLPLLGPSTLRDAVGFGVDTVTNPWALFENRELGLGFQEQAARTALQLIDTRANLLETADPVLESALDPFATTKSAYLQARTQAINDGAVPTGGGGAFEEMEEFDGFEFGDEDDAADDDAASDAADDGEPAGAAPDSEDMPSAAEMPAPTDQPEPEPGF